MAICGPLFPDEPIWSGCARLKRRFRIADEAVSHIVCDKGSGFVQFVLPRHGKDLAKAFCYSDDWQTLLAYHTYWPWMSPYLGRKTHRLHEQHFCSRDRNEALRVTATEPRVFFRDVSLSHIMRACGECAEEDDEIFGEIYFHRQHQFRPLKICPKHLCPLLQTSVEISAMKGTYTPLTWQLIEQATSLELLDEFQIILARGLLEVTRFPGPYPEGAETINERLRRLLWEAGLPSLCSSATASVLDAIGRKFGKSAAMVSQDLFWEHSLSPHRQEAPCPTQTVIICALLDLPIPKAVVPDASARLPLGTSCFQAGRESQAPRTASYQKLTGNDLAPNNTQICAKCWKNLRHSEPAAFQCYLDYQYFKQADLAKLRL